MPHKLKTIISYNRAGAVMTVVVLSVIILTAANIKSAAAINKPDFIVDSIVPEANGSGFPVITIKNQGTASFSGKVDILLALFNNAYTALYPNTSFRPEVNLPPGTTYSFVPKKFKARYRGARYIRAIVDPAYTSKIDELDDDNNTKDADVPLPDLVINNVSFDMERRPTFIVLNQGTAKAKQYSNDKRIGIFAGWYGEAGAVGKSLGKKRWPLPDLLPGQSVTKTWEALPPLKTKYFSALATLNPDPYAGLHVNTYAYELNENNNSWFGTIPLPDLSLGTPTFDASKKPIVTVTNQGSFLSNPLVIVKGITLT